MKKQILIIGIIIIATVSLANAGDIVFEDGSLNVSAALFVDSIQASSDNNVLFEDKVIINASNGRLRLLHNGGGTYQGMLQFYNISENRLWDIRIMADDKMRFYNSSNDLTFQIKQDGDSWFVSDVSALSYTDRTSAPKDSVDVLSELERIKVDNNDCVGNKCQIDKLSLPEEMRVEYVDEETNETSYGRDLTYTVSWLVKVNQELFDRVEELEVEIEELKKE